MTMSRTFQLCCVEIRGVRGTFAKIVRECACGTLQISFSLYYFLPNYPSISIPFLIEKHQILPKFGAFYNNVFKICPIYVIWAPLSLMKSTDRYTKFCKKMKRKEKEEKKNTSKGRHIHIPCKCETSLEILQLSGSNACIQHIGLLIMVHCGICTNAIQLLLLFFFYKSTKVLFVSYSLINIIPLEPELSVSIDVGHGWRID